MACSAFASFSSAESGPVKTIAKAIAKSVPRTEIPRFFLLMDERILSFARRQFPVPASQRLLAGDDRFPERVRYRQASFFIG
jgi:hypothetical protein